MKKKILVSLIGLLFVLSACSPAAPTTEAKMEIPTEQAMEKPTDAMTESPTAEVMEPKKEDMLATSSEDMGGKEMAVPGFFEISLTDVNTGETFKISDYAGKVVLVENLAMWCPNCKKQQEQVKLLKDALGMDSDLITIGFAVDPNENAADLKKYINSNGFDWIYAVPPQEVLDEISRLYGANFLNPPSTPIFVIDRKGTVHPMPFGVKSADDLRNFVDPFLTEGM